MTDRFSQMLRMPCHGTVRHFTAKIDRPTTRPSDSHRITVSVALSKRALGKKHQGIEIALLFESALPEHKGGRLETNGVQRPISGVFPVSEGPRYTTHADTGG